MIKKAILILFLIGITASISWQKSNISCQYLSISDGLSQNSVFSIFQDSKGYMWFGTEDGLNRYDGVDFEIFRYNPDDKFSLTPGTVTDIIEFEDHLWVATEFGLNKLNPGTSKVVRYTSEMGGSISDKRILDLCADEEGNIWIATLGGGLKRFCIEKSRFYHYRHNPKNSSSISSDKVLSLFKDNFNNIWIGTRRGLNRYDEKKDKFERVKHDWSDHTPLIIRDILQDNHGQIWLATQGNGLLRVREDGKITPVRLSLKSDYSLIRVIRQISQDNSGNLWLLTPGKGFCIYDPESGVLTNFSRNSNTLNAWIDDFNLSIIKDTAGDIWIGTWSKGVCRFKSSNFFHYLSGENSRNDSDTNNVFALCGDSSDLLWVGTYSSGLKKLNLISGESFYTNKKFKTEMIHCLTKDFTHQDILWIGSWNNGLIRYNTTTNSIRRYKADKDNSTSISNNIINCLLFDHSSRLWVGTNKGLNLFNNTIEGFSSIVTTDAMGNTLRGKSIVTMYEDRGENIWAGTENGLFKTESDFSDFIHYRSVPEDKKTLGSNYITTIFEDRGGTVWIGTASGGLNRYNNSDNSFKRYLTSSGMPSNTVLGILDDSSGYLWISTNNGLVKFDPRTEVFQIFREQNGLLSNEFNLGAYLKRKNGEIIFGGINGITLFKPELVSPSDFEPPMRIKSITIYPEKEKKKYEYSEDIRLTYQDRMVTIEFVSLDYSAPGLNLYAYKINELHDEWISLGHSNLLTITNLRSGNYTLQIKGSNSDGKWSDHSLSLNIFVSPPFWRTKWFLGLFALLIIALVLIWHRDRMNKQEVRLRSEAHSEEFCRKYKITPREKEIIELVLEGKTNDEMEEILFISSGTVKNHIYNIFQKLKVKNRTQLAGLLSDWKKIKRDIDH